MSGLVEAKRYFSRAQGEVARTFLESEGLHAVVFDGDSFGMVDGYPTEVRLMVLDEDLERALELLGDS